MPARIVTTAARVARLTSPLPSRPVILNSVPELPARKSWFTATGALHLQYFDEMPDPLVPVELTTAVSFERLNVPLSHFLHYVASPPPSSGSSEAADTLYLAQHSPPVFLAPDVSIPDSLLPTPHALTHSSLWLGLAPTTTPLHADPDDNVLYQVRGRKRVRLFQPLDGERVLARVRQRVGSSVGGAGKMRGEEMMRPGPGGERDELERLVWDDAVVGDLGETIEASLDEGSALFIPRKWWHAVRGEALDGGRDRSNASVNWWFR